MTILSTTLSRLGALFLIAGAALMLVCKPSTSISAGGKELCWEECTREAGDNCLSWKKQCLWLPENAEKPVAGIDSIIAKPKAGALAISARPQSRDRAGGLLLEIGDSAGQKNSGLVNAVATLN